MEAIDRMLTCGTRAIRMILVRVFYCAFEKFWQFRFNQSQNLKISKSQNLKISKSQNLKISKSQNLKISKEVSSERCGWLFE
ncbi:hypothetical protein HYN46_13265 [Aquirhabdus parva]|uniref:Uncharacterized protein n=1 Tax=Aquirhabdus parva TaxID=2283318 RepID=A0A345P8V6_9GAMM|nr:hypothetical protein HYN46_13265 [Aquirhabdus parva]